MAAVERYALTARVLHWAVAPLVAALLVLGVGMTRAELSIERMYAAYQWHKSIGVVVWLVMIVRLGVRVGIPPPALPVSVSLQRQRVARGVHGALYAILLIMPVTGWLMVSAAPLTFPIALFDIEVPLLPVLQTLPEVVRMRWYDALKLAHRALAFALFTLVVLHIVGAFSHDRTLRARMNLWRSKVDA